MIDRVMNSGAMPALERMLQFTAQRHGVLADNIANLSTPYFKARDLSPENFQKALGEAIDRRRQQPNPVAGELELRDTRQLKFGRDRMDVKARDLNENILFHDENNRDLDRTMQRLAENTLAHNTAIELMRSELALLETAIRERL